MRVDILFGKINKRRQTVIVPALAAGRDGLQKEQDLGCEDNGQFHLSRCLRCADLCVDILFGKINKKRQTVIVPALAAGRDGLQKEQD